MNDLARDPALESLPVRLAALGHRTVLYIDDNAANRRLVERVFERRPDLELITASRGSPGLDLAYDYQPNLVLLDLSLPDIDGYEVLRRLRADPRTNAIPVIVVSADADQRTIQRLLETGAVAYLTNPIDVHNLIATVDQLTT